MASRARRPSTAPESAQAFSLVEVVLALGICSFVLVALMGLFQVGLSSRREAEDQIEASNMVSQLLLRRSATPTATTSADDAIPSAALTGGYKDAFSGARKYLNANGKLVTDVKDAVYNFTCYAGTNSVTGPRTTQVYIMLTWPPQAPANFFQGKYETITYLPIR